MAFHPLRLSQRGQFDPYPWIFPQTEFYFVLGDIKMEYSASERLTHLVNKELNENGYSIRSFSSKCEISYEEMRRIVNGEKIDPRLSTVEKICKNSEIDIFDVLDSPCELDNASMLVVFHGRRFSMTWKQVV